MKIIKLWFSSPSGAFYFSIKHEDEQRRIFEVFVPFRGFLFFYRTLGDYWNCGGKGFRPLPGLFIFLWHLYRR